MGKRYAHTQSYSDPDKRKRGRKVQEKRLSGSDYALIALIIIAAALMMWLFVAADEVLSDLSEPTPTPYRVYFPFMSKEGETPEPRPTLTASPRPTLESREVENARPKR